LRLFVDGDAFPNLLKPILLRAIERLSLETIVIANKTITLGTSDHVTYEVVDQGADEADHRIVELLNAGDLVITADIPLADRIITKGGHAIDHRGERFSVDNIKQLLAMRDLMEQIRESGEMTKGPKPFTQKDAHAFANQLNALLSKIAE
jgi:uncharacterized protein YaiI (UPF0178 family)